MIDSILEVAPKTQIFITIPAYLANYTETNDLQLFNYSLALDEEFGDEENVHLVPLNLVYNRNKNVGKTKNLPDTEGYNSWGDAMYGAYAAVLQ